MNLENAAAAPPTVWPWYVLTVKPQHERAVAQQLRAKSLEEYLPLYKVTRRWSDRVATVELPLFPRYVFCRSTFEDRLKVLQILSVTSIVSFGGKPCGVDPAEIQKIQSMLASGRLVRPWPYVGVGEHVRVCEGPLEGLEGILVRAKSSHRVVVNVDFLNRAVAVEVDRDMVRRMTGCQ
jgi:transcription antitermination factor NusG